MNPEHFFSPSIRRSNRNIKLKQQEDFITSNILDKRIVKNNKGYLIKDCNLIQTENSFFIRTVIDWNHLDNTTIFNPSLEGFKKSLLKGCSTFH